MNFFNDLRQRSLSSVFIEQSLVSLDRICDYIPFVSTISSIVNIVAQAIFRKFNLNAENNSYYIEHILTKSFKLSIILLIPIFGNFYVILSDVHERAVERKKFTDVKGVNVFEVPLSRMSDDELTDSDDEDDAFLLNFSYMSGFRGIPS